MIIIIVNDCFRLKKCGLNSSLKLLSYPLKINNNKNNKIHLFFKRKGSISQAGHLIWPLQNMFEMSQTSLSIKYN